MILTFFKIDSQQHCHPKVKPGKTRSPRRPKKYPKNSKKPRFVAPRFFASGAPIQMTFGSSKGAGRIGSSWGVGTGSCFGIESPHKR
eukprot:2049992-Amphidinium_carterae.1